MNLRQPILPGDVPEMLKLVAKHLFKTASERDWRLNNDWKIARVLYQKDSPTEAEVIIYIPDFKLILQHTENNVVGLKRKVYDIFPIGTDFKITFNTMPAEIVEELPAVLYAYILANPEIA